MTYKLIAIFTFNTSGHFLDTALFGQLALTFSYDWEPDVLSTLIIHNTVPSAQIKSRHNSSTSDRATGLIQP